MVWTVKVEGRRTHEYRVKRWQKGGHDRLYVNEVIESPRRRWAEPQGYYDLATGKMNWSKRQSNRDLTAKVVAALERIAQEIRAEAAAMTDPDVC